MKWIDDFLNKITMYRLVLYVLAFFLVAAEIFSILKILPYNPLMLLFSVVAIIIICWLVNFIFARTFNAPTNVESFWITALILALIITPPASLADTGYLWFIFWAAVWAMASKYILAIGKKHIFNPAAFGVALTYLTIGQSASWWVGTASMMPLVLIGGFLVVKKIRRFDLVLSFLGSFLLFALILHAKALAGIPSVLKETILNSPMLFFAGIMLTEPLTTPPTRPRRAAYGILTGAIFDPLIHLGGLYSTPELALLFGNLFSYFVSPKKKLILTLKERWDVAKNTIDFGFIPDKKLAFKAGQYLELTLAHHRPDARGNRRYFTIASAPTDEDIYFGIKFYPEPSSFKQRLLRMKKGEKLVAGQLAGDFTLPDDVNKKLCFIAGGIGATPYRSMLGLLLAKKERRDIVMFYSNRRAEDIAYADTIEEARNELGVKTVFTLAELESIPSDWNGERGFITDEMLKKYMPDWRERLYYVSGPPSMVDAFKKTLRQMGIHRSHIKTDFFPGYA
ncbi:MAG TPA: RnfABCDGE type electron transport complex subunit D [Candidatus Paceibacterota bacterium]|jgi:ferredoxin-NADP reductase|nr:RnfABCDGE type electron transport complex subunit D [Candidatus Paceibacterota bacterium]